METEFIYPGLFRFRMTNRYMKKILYWKIIHDNLTVDQDVLLKLQKYSDLEYNQYRSPNSNLEHSEDREYIDYLES